MKPILQHGQRLQKYANTHPLHLQTAEFHDHRAKSPFAFYLALSGTTVEMLDAVLANRPGSPLDAVMRLHALKEFLLLPEAGVLAAINKRIANILKKTSLGPKVAVNADALTEEAERQLHNALRDLRVPVQEAAAQRRYAQSLKSLVALRVPVDDFFERIMVMDDNLERRNNRLALLRDVQLLLSGVADLKRLPG